MGRTRDDDRHALSARVATRVAATLARGDDCRIFVAGQNPATRLDVDQAPSRRVRRCVWHGRRLVLGGGERLGATAGDLFHDARIATARADAGAQLMLHHRQDDPGSDVEPGWPGKLALARRVAAIDRSGDRRAVARHAAAEANESRRLFQETPCDACRVRDSVDRPGNDRTGAPAARYLMPNLHAKIFAIVWRRSIVETKKQRVIRQLPQDPCLPLAI